MVDGPSMGTCRGFERLSETIISAKDDLEDKLGLLTPYFMTYLKLAQAGCVAKGISPLLLVLHDPTLHSLSGKLSWSEYVRDWITAKV